MSIYSLQQQKNIILVIIILLGMFLAYMLKDIFTSALGAIILYTLLRNYFIRLITVRKWNRPVSALFIIFISLIVIVLPFLGLSLMVIDKISFYSSNTADVQNIINHFAGILNIDLEHSETFADIIKKIESWALGSFPSVLNGTLNVFLLISVMYFILYFMFTSYEIFEQALMKYLPFKESNALMLAEEMHKITQTNVIGQGIIALAQGICVGIGFWLFSIPDPFFWGVCATLLSFVPVVGSALVFVPAGLIAISYNQTFNGVGILIWGALVVANIDNVLRLIINKKIANIHPLISIIGVIIGLPMFGILGLVFGPMLISFFLLLIKIYESKVTSEKIIGSSDNPLNNG